MSEVFTAKAVLEVAMGELGKGEDPPGSNKTVYNREFFGRNVKAWWCGTFVWFVFREAGYDIKKHGLPRAAETNFLDKKAVKAGWTKVPKSKAQPGDMVLYNFGSTFDGDPPDDADHVGIVSQAAKGRFLHSIEGNTSPTKHGSQSNGDGVHEKKRPLTQVKSVYRPPYEVAAITAPDEEFDMFIASTLDPDDPAVYVVSTEGKRRIPNTKILEELVRIGIPHKGDVSAKTLTMFPTLP